MLTFLLEMIGTAYDGAVHVFSVLFALVFVLWLIRLLLSLSYKPWTADYDVATAVVIPVVDEPLDLFADVLARIRAQKPTELVVVINGARNHDLELVCERAGVRHLWTPQAGKRHAVELGVAAVSSEIVVLVDSDTLWTPGTLAELRKPFIDPKVGGVTTQQHILSPDRNMWTRWAEWMESVRNSYSMPAMSVLGSVGCLPGRTIAFRRQILVDNMDKFMHDKFLGVHLEISDDRSLTNYALRDGYKTVYQSSSLVFTDAPTRLGKLTRQQYRWSRGSQYNTLRMAGWMLVHAPVLALFYFADIAIPFLVVGSFLTWGVRALFGLHDSNPYEGLLAVFGPTTTTVGGLVLATIVMSWLYAAIRFAKPITDRPVNFWWLPMFMLINIVLLVPIRVWGFARSAHTGSWGTRAGAHTAKTEFNGFVAIPYLLTLAGLAGIVAFGVLCYG